MSKSLCRPRCRDRREAKEDAHWLLRGCPCDPDITQMVRGIAPLLHYQMAQNPQTPHTNPFCETWYVGKKTGALPSLGETESFLDHLLVKGAVAPPCSIASYIYVCRFLGVQSEFSPCGLTRDNWRILMLTALMAADKFWDDTPLGNSQFALVYPALSAHELKVVEREFLHVLDFRLSILPSVYLAHYFQIRRAAQLSHSSLFASLAKSNVVM